MCHEHINKLVSSISDFQTLAHELPISEEQLRSIKYFFHFYFIISCWFSNVALNYYCDFLCFCKEGERNVLHPRDM